MNLILNLVIYKVSNISPIILILIIVITIIIIIGIVYLFDFLWNVW